MFFSTDMCHIESPSHHCIRRAVPSSSVAYLCYSAAGIPILPTTHPYQALGTTYLLLATSSPFPEQTISFRYVHHRWRFVRNEILVPLYLVLRWLNVRFRCYDMYKSFELIDIHWTTLLVLIFLLCGLMLNNLNETDFKIGENATLFQFSYIVGFWEAPST